MTDKPDGTESFTDDVSVRFRHEDGVTYTLIALPAPEDVLRVRAEAEGIAGTPGLERLLAGEELVLTGLEALRYLAVEMPPRLKALRLVYEVAKMTEAL